MSLRSTHSSRFQNITAKAISTTACRGLATKGVTLESHRQMTKENITIIPINIAITIRLKKIAILVIQKTKLEEKKEENLMKKNPRITIISNNRDSKAGVVFIINNDNIKESTNNQWNHTIIIRVSVIQIRKNK